MSRRLDQQREAELGPQRMEYAIQVISSMGYIVHKESEQELKFQFKGSWIKFFPYSGWHTGKTIKDGRGLNNLIKQVQP